MKALRDLYRELVPKDETNLVKRNIAWLVGERGMRMGLGFLVTSLVARYLGPDQFGLLSFSLAIVAIASSLSGLGLERVVVKRLVDDDRVAPVCIGTSAVFRLIASLAVIACIVSVCIVTGNLDSRNGLVLIVLSLMLFSQSASVVDYWFSSKVVSKGIVSIQVGSFIGFSCVRLLMVYWELGLVSIVWSFAIEALVIGISKLIYFSRVAVTFRDLTVSVRYGIGLIQESWPFLVSAFSVLIYMKSDLLMVGVLVGNESAGFYEIAVRICSIGYFIPTVLVTTFYPMISKKRADLKCYYKRLENLFSLLALLGMLNILAILLFGHFVVDLVFGEAYSGAGVVLVVYSFSTIFVFMGHAQAIWNINEGMQKNAMIRHFSGAMLNLLLNFLFIPKFGIEGAAFATCISFFYSHFLSNLFNEKTRAIFIIQAKSFVLLPFFRFLSTK